MSGSFADREHRKWVEEAVVLPNNPYTTENIVRRFSFLFLCRFYHLMWLQSAKACYNQKSWKDVCNRSNFSRRTKSITEESLVTLRSPGMYVEL